MTTLQAAVMRARWAARPRPSVVPIDPPPSEILTAPIWMQRLVYPRLGMSPPLGPRHVITRILRATAEYFGVDPLQITAPNRTKKIVLVRQVGMYLAYELTRHSLPEIGRRCGNRDHTTVLHAVRKIAKLITYDDELGEQIMSLRAKLVAAEVHQ